MKGNESQDFGELPGPARTGSRAVVDMDQALDRVGGDMELYCELLDMLFEDASDQVREMKEAIERGDTQWVERVAHSLKGAAANLEAGPVRDAALWLEMLGREANLAGAVEALAELETEMKRLRRFAEALG